MSPAPPWLRAAERRAARAVRRARAARGAPIEQTPIELVSTVGYRLAATVHRQRGARPGPGVVLCPGIDDGQAIFSTEHAPVRADEIARLGCTVLTFDPAGRGESWGVEDFGGPEHQDNVCCAVEALAAQPSVDGSRVGIVAISLGIAMATGAAAGAHGPRARIDWLVDWEGPSDREIITAGGAKMAPAMGHKLDDEVYWQPREAARHVGQLQCGYLRLQSRSDHAQPGELRHAERMIAAAAQGQLPWFQLNQHPPGEVQERPEWLRPGQLAANRAILRAVAELVRGVSG